MHIGLTTEYLANTRSGVETATMQLLLGLKKTGHKITCFHTRNPRHPRIQGVNHYLFRARLPIPLYQSFAAFFRNKCFESVDILHLPFPHMPYIRKPKVPVVTTIYDISPILFPQFHIWKLNFFFRKILPHYLSGTDRIIASSHATKNDIIRHYRIPQEKISVVHLATDIPKPSKQKRKPFILYVGTLEPRKNIPGLLHAFAQVKRQGYQHKLVIAGRKGWGYERIFTLIKKLGLEQEVIYKGYISEEEKKNLYETAALFAYPSFYEGFGIPVLEAMAHGTPVVTSNNSSLPEVAGDAGILVDPTRPETIAAGMLRVLSSPHEARRLSRKGLQRAKLFTVNRMIKQTLAEYEEAMR